MVKCMKKLYIDFDGVILNTIEKSYEILKNKNINTKDFIEVTKFYRSLNWNEFIKECNQINDSILCLKKLIDSKMFDVNILTHVNTKEESIAKKEYLEQYFNDIKFIAVDRNIAKTDAVEVNNAILVDDFKENLIDWENHGGIGIHFDENLKKSKFKVINRLDELINVFSSQE